MKTAINSTIKTFAAFFATDAGERTNMATDQDYYRATLAKVSHLQDADRCMFMAALAMRQAGPELGTVDSCLTAINLLSGSASASDSGAQAERRAMFWLERDMSGVLQDARAELATDEGDGQGRSFVACVRDLVLLRDGVDREEFAAAVRTLFAGRAGQLLH